MFAICTIIRLLCDKLGCMTSRIVNSAKQKLEQQDESRSHHAFESKTKIIVYRGRCIWTLEDNEPFPWCAWVHSKHKEYKTLEDAKADIDFEQDNIKERVKLNA